jgi:hypothetical protein
LPTIRLLNEAPHRFLPQESRENHNSTTAFSHSQGHFQTPACMDQMPASASIADIIT